MGLQKRAWGWWKGLGWQQTALVNFLAREQGATPAKNWKLPRRQGANVERFLGSTPLARPAEACMLLPNQNLRANPRRPSVPPARFSTCFGAADHEVSLPSEPTFITPTVGSSKHCTEQSRGPQHPGHRHAAAGMPGDVAWRLLLPVPATHRRQRTRGSGERGGALFIAWRKGEHLGLGCVPPPRKAST